MQTQNYPKGGLLDGLCPASSAPSTLGPEQDFQMFPKAQLSTVSVNYCSISQDFPAGTLNLLSSSSGKIQASERPSQQGCQFDSQSHGDMSSDIRSSASGGGQGLVRWVTVPTVALGELTPNVPQVPGTGGAG